MSAFDNIYSTTVDFVKYGVQNFTLDLNVGALLGQQTIVVRVNWADHNNETRTTNNSVLPEVVILYAVSGFNVGR